MNQAITDFFALPIEDQHYEDAVILYAKYGTNRLLKAHFAMRQNPYNAEKVLYELRRIAGIAQPKTEAKKGKEVARGQEPPPRRPKTRTSTEIEPMEGNAEEHQAAYDESVLRRAHLINQKGILANTLATFAEGDNEGRKRVMDEIGKMDDEISNICRRIDSYEKTGKMPAVLADAAAIEWSLAQNPLDLAKQQTNLRSQISKATKAGNTEKMGILAQRLQAVNVKLEEIRGESAAGEEQG